MSAARAPLLRYSIDVVSVLVVLVTLATQLTAYVLELPWFTVVPIIVLTRWLHLVEHNHSHLPLSHYRSINEALGWLMFLSGGVPLEAYRVFHVQTHHRYTNHAGDWTSPFAYEGARFPDRPVSLPYYVLTYSLMALCRVVIALLQRPSSAATKRFLLSLAVVGTACAFLIHHDAPRFLLLFYVPWLVTYLVAPLANWFQHVGCVGAGYTSANVNLSVLCGILGFNIGYHSAHHMKPALHWSKLAAFHWAEVAPHVPEQYYRPIPLERWQGRLS